MKTQLNLDPYEDIHDPISYILVKSDIPEINSAKAIVSLEACLRFLTFQELVKIITLNKATSSEAIKGLKKKALIELTSIQKTERLMLWRSFFTESAQNMKFKTYTDAVLDDDDNIINLDVKRTYSNNASFDKAVNLPFNQETGQFAQKHKRIHAWQIELLPRSQFHWRLLHGDARVTRGCSPTGGHRLGPVYD